MSSTPAEKKKKKKTGQIHVDFPEKRAPTKIKSLLTVRQILQNFRKARKFWFLCSC